jgi:hypothetical protein
MELDNGDVFFTGTLLGLDESGRVVDAGDEASSNLWIKGSRMAGLVDLKDFLYPSNNLVRRWVRWLVKVDDTVLLEGLDWSVERRVSTREWSEVVGFDIECIIVL